MTGLTSPMVQEFGQIFMDLQTEIVFFALAIATHLLFFNKLRPASLLKGKKMVDSPMKSQLNQKAPPNSSLVALKAALRASDLETALEHFEALQSLWQMDESPSSAPRMLMEQLVKLAVQKGALSTLIQRLVKLGLLSKSLDLVISECADSTALKEVEQLARKNDVKFTPGAYQALIKVASTAADAKKTMSEAQEAGAADVATYTAYMHALLNFGNNTEVRKIMQTVKAAGMHLNAIAFNKLLGTASAFSAEGVWSIVEEMKAFGVKPDQISCAIILKNKVINSRASNLEKAMSLLEGLDEEIDEVLFNSVVDASVRVGRADLLMPFLKSTRTQQRVVVKGAHTYGSIIRAYGYVQDIKGAWDTWEEMRKQHVTPISVTLGCMVEALVTNGDLEGGYELIHDMLSDEKTASLVNAVMYGSLVKGFSHNKCFSRVWEVYEEMVSQKLQFSMVTFNTLIDTCARSGELNRIPALLKDIEAQGLKMGLVTYSAILKGYCQKNMIDEAFELFDDMTRTTELQPDEIMYNSLIDGCARQGLYDRGMALFDKMKKSGVRPSNYTLSVLVKLADRAKKIEKAFAICEELTSKYGFRLNVHVFANLVAACIRQHDVPRAIGVLERMLQEHVRPDVRTYSLLLRACIDARQPKEAGDLLRAACGLSGVNPVFAKHGKAAIQPQGGLPADVISEILTGIMNGREERLAAALLVDLNRSMPNLKVDPKLRLRLAARMSDL